MITKKRYKKDPSLKEQLQLKEGISLNIPISGKSDLEIWTDGACVNGSFKEQSYTGSGDYAAVIINKVDKRVVVVSGNEESTTSQRMELLAAIMGLYKINRGSRIEVFSDSKYLVNGITDWVFRWKSNHWRLNRKGTEMVKNQDLWETLLEVSKAHKIRWTWVKGHAGHVLNERCDRIAQSEARKIA